MAEKTLDLGAQHPELKNSPVVWEVDEAQSAASDSLADEPVCFFNDGAYPHGTVV